MASDIKPTSKPKTTKRRSQRRFEFLNAFIDRSMADLSRAEVAVWLILYRDTKSNSTAKTAVSDIARRAGIDRRSVLRAMKRLRDRRMLKVVKRGGLNLGPSTYCVVPVPYEQMGGLLL